MESQPRCRLQKHALLEVPLRLPRELSCSNTKYFPRIRRTLNDFRIQLSMFVELSPLHLLIGLALPERMSCI